MKARSIRPTATTSAVAFCSVNSLTDLVHDLKKSVSQRLTREFRKSLPVALIRRAVDDAVETAQETGFPHLFFPILAEEKVRLVSAAVHQDHDHDHAVLSHAA